MHPTTFSRLTSLLALLFVGIGTAAAQLPPPPAHMVPRAQKVPHRVERCHQKGCGRWPGRARRKEAACGVGGGPPSV